MARPQKNNLDYFSHDKDLRNDLKIRNLRRKFSHKGYSVYVMMLEHLADCEYLQYKWDELSIELLVPDFDIDVEDLIEIVNHCVKLELLQLDEGYLYSTKFYDRNSEVLNTRKGFDLNNSPLTQLKRNKQLNNSVNSQLTTVNSGLIHKEKESKVEYNTEKQTKLKDSIVEDSKEQQSIKEDNKEALKEQLKGHIMHIFQDEKVLKYIEKKDMDAIERLDKYKFNMYYSLIAQLINLK